MRHDYAKRAGYLPSAHSKKRAFWQLRLIIVVIFISFTLGLVYLGKHHYLKTTVPVPQKVAPKKVVPTKHLSKPEVAKKADVIAKSKTSVRAEQQDVKTESPKKAAKVRVSANAAASTQPLATTATEFDFYTLLPQMKTPTIMRQYELEIKKTEDLAEANNLKIQLKELGYETNLTTAEIDGTTVYLVTLGPFEQKLRAIEYQKQLRKKNIVSRVKAIKPT